MINNLKTLLLLQWCNASMPNITSNVTIIYLIIVVLIKNIGERSEFIYLNDT